MMIIIFFICLLNSSKQEIYGRSKRDFYVILTKTIPFTLNPNNQMMTEVCIGTPPQCFPFKIATNMNACFVLSSNLTAKGYNPSLSSTASPRGNQVYFEHSKSKYSGVIQKDVFTVANSTLTLQDFPFYLVTNGELSKYFIGVIGLGRMYIEPQFSFIRMAIKQKFLHKHIFSFQYLPDESRGYLTIGYHDTSNKLEYRKTPMIETKYEPYFETNLTGIIYTKNKVKGPPIVRTYMHEQAVLFSPGASHIFCPVSFFKFIIEKFIEDDFHEKFDLCELDDRIQNFVTLTCEEKILKKELGSLMFIFQKWNIELSFKDLFVKCKNKVCLDIVQINDENKWIFGYPFLKRYPLIFDVELSSFFIKISKISE